MAMTTHWLLNKTRFCINENYQTENEGRCYWGLPSISADDPTFPPLGYWRGYVWYVRIAIDCTQEMDLASKKRLSAFLVWFLCVTGRLGVDSFACRLTIVSCCTHRFWCCIRTCLQGDRWRSSHTGRCNNMITCRSSVRLGKPCASR